MRREPKTIGIWLLRLVLALPLAQSGHAQASAERSVPVPAQDHPPAGAAPSQFKSAKRTSPETSPARRKKKRRKNRSAALAAEKMECKDAPTKNSLKLNPRKVLALQMQALNAQCEREDGEIPAQNRFTLWLDAAHQRTYRWMDDAVRRIDMKWLAEEAPYDPELSTFKLKLMTRTGGKSSEKDFDFKVRFRADMALPGLERKLHLYLDNAGRDELPGTDPMKKESDTRLGVRAMFRTLKGNDLSLGGGLRWRDSNPVVYLGTDWRWERESENGVLCLNPQVAYYSDEGFGQKTELTWTRPVGVRKFFQTRTAERSSESLDSVEFEQSLRFAWLRSGRGRGWVAQVSVFPHIRSSDWYWDDSMVNLTWRDALYRKWIYYTITPQVQFPKEDEYKARPSLRIGLEILFGGIIGELL